jgi:HK97 gp10 family phage protein
VSGGNVTLKVEGLRELEQQLVQIAEKAPGIIAKALKGPMEQVLEDVKSLVPEDTGALKEALALTPVRRANWRRASMADTLSEVGIRIRKTWGPKGRPRSYWHLVEFGTAHSAAKPYLRPAFDRNVQRMVGEFTTVTRAELDRIHGRSRYAPKGY